jgi:hypothetical protein
MKKTVELERTDCGMYCTPDERFLLNRDVDEGRPRRRWVIHDSLGEFTFATVRTLRDAEEAIAKAVLAEPSDPVDEGAEADLGELAVIANKFHDQEQEAGKQEEEAGRARLEAAWNAGQALLAAKELCKHGEWLPWLDANFHGTQRTAQRYMAIASKTTRVSDLEKASIRGALETISLKDKLDDEPSPKPKGKRGKAKTPSQKFEKRCIALSDDISFIVHTAEKDAEFAAAASNSLDQLVEQRDEGMTPSWRRATVTAVSC